MRNGFREGTTHIALPDKMKEWDHRRHKANCVYYYDKEKCFCKEIAGTKCVGSAHCNFYSDSRISSKERFDDSGFLKNREKLKKAVKTLENKISWTSFEGGRLPVVEQKKSRMEKLEYDEKDLLSKIKELENQLKEKKALLKKEIEQFNQNTIKENDRIEKYNLNLRRICILVSLFIFTAPFCFIYYIENVKQKIQLRDFEKEQEKLEWEIQKEKEKLEKLLPDIKKEILAIKEQFKNKAIKTKEKYFYNNREICYKEAKEAFEKKDYGLFVQKIIQSLEKRNDCSVLFLAEIFEQGEFVEKDSGLSRLLLLYSSYLGNKESYNKICRIV